MAGSQIQIFTWMYTQFDTVLNNYISEKASDIAAAISPVAFTMFGIYVLLWGFSMVRGLIEEPVTDGLFRLLKIGLIMGFALNVGTYQTQVVDFVMKTPDAMAQVLVLGSTTEDGGASTYGTLDTILNKTIDAAGEAYDQISVLSPGQSFALAISAAAILLFGLAFTVVAGIMIVLAKVGMVVLLALGPLFIVLMMFPTTQRFFEAWVTQLVNSMMTLVLLLAVCSLFFGLAGEAIGKAGGVVQDDPLQAVAIVGVACSACTFLLFSVPSVASGLAGGVSLQIGEAAKKMTGLSGASRAAERMQSQAVMKGAGMAGGVAGAAVGYAASKVGGLFRATNSIKRG